MTNRLLEKFSRFTVDLTYHEQFCSNETEASEAFDTFVDKYHNGKYPKSDLVKYLINSVSTIYIIHSSLIVYYVMIYNIQYLSICMYIFIYVFLYPKQDSGPSLKTRLSKI